MKALVHIALVWKVIVFNLTKARYDESCENQGWRTNRNMIIVRRLSRGNWTEKEKGSWQVEKGDGNTDCWQSLSIKSKILDPLKSCSLVKFGSKLPTEVIYIYIQLESIYLYFPPSSQLVATVENKGKLILTEIFPSVQKK